jgi:hypothetical protein
VALEIQQIAGLKYQGAPAITNILKYGVDFKDKSVDT